jgi:hypothetical protein
VSDHFCEDFQKECGSFSLPLIQHFWGHPYGLSQIESFYGAHLIFLLYLTRVFYQKEICFVARLSRCQIESCSLLETYSASEVHLSCDLASFF